MSNNKYNFTEEDYKFMQNLNAAILEKSPIRVSRVISVVFVTIIILGIWASLTQIDEITRGSGDVVPSGDNQIVQNLEGGITEEILIKEGDIVKQGQVLIKIRNAKSTSSFESNEIKLKELRAKNIRLLAESNNKKFIKPKTKDSIFREFMDSEYSLYQSHLRENKLQTMAINQQIEQKKSEIKEINGRIKHLKKSVALIDTEVKMTGPMVKEGIKSRVEYLKLQREFNEVEQKLNSAEDSLPSIRSQITELRHERKQNKLNFQNKAKEEFNKLSSEIKQIGSNKIALSDQVSRTEVRSPVSGIVKKLFIHTLGGVISPGSDLIEIVPSEDNLLLEVKIKPSDIAFIHPGAKTMVKFSAYDFSIHGGLNGEIVRISPDTITDEKDNKFYLIYVKTDKTHLGSEEKPLSIIPGMMVDVDIVTGKKTIMEYILKPILKSKTYVFSER